MRLRPPSDVVVRWATGRRRLGAGRCIVRTATTFDKRRRTRSIRRDGGRHRGDGFFATFDGPARAVRRSRSIGAFAGEYGWLLRAGVHTGEVETIDRKVGGIAVHIGSRIGALAAPAQIFVSSTVKDMTAGTGLTFVDAGEHELKGVPELWRPYRDVDG